MAHERSSPRASAATIVTFLALLAGSACQGQRPPDVVQTATETPTVETEGSPSDKPSSDVRLVTFALASRDELFDHLRDVGWSEALVLPDANRSDFSSGRVMVTGMRVSITACPVLFVSVVQAGSEALPHGRLVRIRGEHGIRSQGILYWIEREFTLSISPGRKAHALQLEWIPLR